METTDEPYPFIESEITYHEFKCLFNNTRESTASSPSGIHIGHYKAAELYPEIGNTLTKMISIPMMHGFSPSRWKQSIHLMLEKTKTNEQEKQERVLRLKRASRIF